MHFFSFVLIVMVSVGSQAALQPLSQAEQESHATHIVEGQVLDISCANDESNRGIIVVRYKVRLKVMNAQSKDSSYIEIKNDDEIEISYKKIIHKARNWSGNTGQSRNVEKGQFIRAYVSAGADYSLLEPNGFVVLQAKQ